MMIDLRKCCKHGRFNPHRVGPFIRSANPKCKKCKGDGYTIGVSGSDAYAVDCECTKNDTRPICTDVEPSIDEVKEWLNHSQK